MDATLASFLADFYAECRAFDDGQPDRLARWRNLEPDSAALLAFLARSAQPASILELGTSNGYSTCWLADAAGSTGAALTSVDLDPGRIAAAEDTLSRAGLRDRVTLACDDAAEVLRRTEDASVGLLFLDAERPYYVGYWPDIARVLGPDGVLVTDNVLSHPDQVADFVRLIEEAGWFCTTVPTGAGMFLARRS